LPILFNIYQNPIAIKNKMINVTKTFLPPQKEYKKYLDKIWESHQVKKKEISKRYQICSQKKKKWSI